MRLFGKRVGFPRRVRRREEFRLIHTSGVVGFEFEVEHDGLNVFSFACDEEDGPVSVFFHPDIRHYEIDLVALRKLLDDAEAALFERRREWQEMPPLEG